MYKTSSIANINICLSNLSLINTISFYATIYLSALADILSILLTAFRGLYSSVELIIDTLTTVYVNISINLKSDSSIQFLSKIFEYTINNRAFCASYIYRYTDRFLFSAVATSLCAITASLFLRSLSSIISRAGDIFPIRDIMLYTKYQIVYTAINISLCSSVCYLGNTTSVTNNLSQSFYISDLRKSEFDQVATEKDYKQLQR